MSSAPGSEDWRRERIVEEFEPGLSKAVTGLRFQIDWGPGSIPSRDTFRLEIIPMTPGMTKTVLYLQKPALLYFVETLAKNTADYLRWLEAGMPDDTAPFRAVDSRSA